jgi:2,3-dihydroxybiphenyl 1,2-dioxygenase
MSAPDLGAWRTYATDVLGLQVADDLANSVRDGLLYLKQDERSYRLAIESGAPGTTTFGWEVANRHALDGIAARLDGAGYSVEEASAEYAQSRMTIAMMLTNDPAGNRCEFYYGPSSDKQGFVSPINADFCTGDMGLGHAFMVVPDAKAFEKFYSHLGFQVSDYISLSIGLGTFMHCNSRHHTLAFVEKHGVSQLQHLMLEVSSIDTVGRSYDKCVAGAAPIVMSLGRHTNDQMFSFYSASPSGSAVEFGHGGIKVDDATWTVQRFDAASYWGHARPARPSA